MGEIERGRCDGTETKEMIPREDVSCICKSGSNERNNCRLMIGSWEKMVIRSRLGDLTTEWEFTQPIACIFELKTKAVQY